MAIFSTVNSPVRRRWRIGAGLLFAVSLPLISSCGKTGLSSSESGSSVVKAASVQMPESPSGYYGVYTSSNVVLFGKLVRADAEWVVLKDVHYIRTNMDPEKKQMANQLVKRNREWHQPSESAIARSQILVVEPVATDSRMMTLIRDMK
jgi:hypothetical protein